MQCAALINMSFNVQPWLRYKYNFWLRKPYGLDMAGLVEYEQSSIESLRLDWLEYTPVCKIESC